MKIFNNEVKMDRLELRRLDLKERDLPFDEAVEIQRLNEIDQRTRDLLTDLFAEAESFVARAGRLSIIRSTKPSTQGKRLRKGVDGNLVTERPNNLLEGIARVAFFEDASGLVDILAGLDHSEALSPQVPNASHHPVRLATMAGKDVFSSARCGTDFHAHEGRGVIVIDYDPPPGAALSKRDLIDKLLGLVPGLRDAGLVWWASSSSYIFDDEREIVGLRGQRIYVVVADTTDTKRVLEIINKRAWLAGLGRVEVSKSGAVLVRGLADEAMSTAARLDYVGGSICELPLSQRRPRPEVVNLGGFLNTRLAITDLSEKEEGRYQAFVARAKRDAKPEADRVRANWRAERQKSLTKRLTSFGVPEPEARQRAAATVAAVATGQLAGDYEIHLADGRVVTVRDILDDRTAFNGLMTLDPVEPDYRGTKAVGHLNLDGEEPNLFSHAHGGTRYALFEEPDHVAQMAGECGVEPGSLLVEGERGARKPMAQSNIANLIAGAFSGRFGFEAEADTWHRWTGTYWALDPKGAGIARGVHAGLEVGLHPLGFAASVPQGVQKLLETGGRLDVELDRSGRFLPFANGVLNLEARQLVPHDPRLGMSWCLPYEYDEFADCPTIKSWLRSALQDDDSLVQFLRAAAAAILTGRHDLQVFFYLRGVAGSGKGTFTRLITAMLGDVNVHNTSLKHLEDDQFELAALQGKRLVVIADASRHGGSVEALKNLTGGDRLRLRRMHQDSATFRFEGSVLIASNDELVTTDPSSALARRRRNIVFERPATAEERAAWARSGGESVVLHSELPGFVNWLLELSRDEVTEAIRNPPEAVVLANEVAEQANNHVARWLRERCAPDPDGHVTAWGVGTEKGSNDLYPAFLRFCEEEGVRPFSLPRFKALLPETCRTLGWTVQAGGKMHRAVSGRCGVRGLVVIPDL